MSCYLHKLLALALLCCFTQPPVSHAANILVLLPHEGYSHSQVSQRLLQSLAERGHNLTVITYIKNPTPHANYRDLLLESPDSINKFNISNIVPNRSFHVLFKEFLNLHNEGQKSCEIFYKSGYVERIIAEHAQRPFDLVITEFFNTDCYLGLPYLLELPVVGLSSCALFPWHYDRIMLNDAPSHVQSEFNGFPEQLNWKQRLENFIQSRVFKLLYRFHTNHQDNKLIKKYLDVYIDVHNYAKTSTSLLLVNQHYTLSGSRPTSPQLLEIGGIHIDKERLNIKLPTNIEDFLQKAKNGVLYISWGSMVRSATMPKDKVQLIIRVLKKLPLRVIWKWEDDVVPIVSEQFLFIKWAPQLNLLCHPKVKLFWSHGGLFGVTEAVHCAKPMLMTPLYGDQFLNSHAVEQRKIGLTLLYDDLSEQRLAATLQEALRIKYAENVAILSKLFKDRSQDPLQLSVWWIEHLLRHGKLAGELLRQKAATLNWFVYYSLDSIFILLGALLLAIIVFSKLSLVLILKLRKHSKVKTN